MNDDNRLGKHLNNSTKIYTPIKPVTGEAQGARMNVKNWERNVERGLDPPALVITRNQQQALRKTDFRRRPGKDTFLRGDPSCEY